MTAGPAPGTAEHATRFQRLRPLLFTVAYEILGTATEADDVLQDSYLRWARVDPSAVRDTKAYLAQLVTRQSLNLLRARSRRREEYVGPWLPEPLLIAEGDAGDDVLLAESVSMAMLVGSQTLSPDERAVFVLREVFGFGHDEIATATGKSPAAVRQTAHRARQHVRARRKRFDLIDPAATEELTERFLAAAATGELDELLQLLAPDVVWIADGGGKVSATRRPIVGASKVAALLLGLLRQGGDAVRIEPARHNKSPSLRIYLGDRLESLVLLGVVDGRITDFYAIRNPDKLTETNVIREIARTPISR